MAQQQRGIPLAREKGASSVVRFHSTRKWDVQDTDRGALSLDCMVTSMQLQPKFLYCRHGLLAMILPSANSSFVVTRYESCIFRSGSWLYTHSFRWSCIRRLFAILKTHMSRIESIGPVSTHLSYQFFVRKKKSSAFVKKVGFSRDVVKSPQLWN